MEGLSRLGGGLGARLAILSGVIARGRISVSTRKRAPMRQSRRTGHTSTGENCGEAGGSVEDDAEGARPRARRNGKMRTAARTNSELERPMCGSNVFASEVEAFLAIKPPRATFAQCEIVRTPSRWSRLSRAPSTPVESNFRTTGLTSCSTTGCPSSVCLTRKSSTNS